MVKNIIILLSILGIFCFGFGQEIVVHGIQESEFNFRLEQNITPFAEIDILSVSFVTPQDFFSKTYTQRISDLNFKFTQKPTDKDTSVDQNGNKVNTFFWESPQNLINCSLSFSARNSVELKPLKSAATFPNEGLPSNIYMYLNPSKLVQSNAPELQNKANELTMGISFQYEAVQAILHFIVDHLRYDLFPDKYDALYAYKNRRGNCQNYSHLAAALMRAVGIPVRIINGITLEKEYSVRIGESEFSFDMATGRHSWIEVYFSDIGWVPFDAQQTEFFVSNRYIRFEVGIDNDDTIQDGLVKWTEKGEDTDKVPKLEETIESNFVRDKVTFLSEKKLSGPNKLLLTPAIEIELPLAEVEIPEPIITGEKEITDSQLESSLKPTLAELDYTKLKYEVPFQHGNLDFPKGFDFISARFWEPDLVEAKGELRRNFIVETAEYVTGKEQFAQIFIINEPILLKKIGIPLHVFGGNGFLWLEISEDISGHPGEPAAASRKIPIDYIRIPRGYDWVDFDLSSDGLILSPGIYWFTFHYSGSPIVNWFYTYGKPVGPADGTRRRPFGKRKWREFLSYEFNYRIIGLGVNEIPKE